MSPNGRLQLNRPKANSFLSRQRLQCQIPMGQSQSPGQIDKVDHSFLCRPRLQCQIAMGQSKSPGQISKLDHLQPVATLSARELMSAGRKKGETVSSVSVGSHSSTALCRWNMVLHHGSFWVPAFDRAAVPNSTAVADYDTGVT